MNRYTIPTLSSILLLAACSGGPAPDPSRERLGSESETETAAVGPSEEGAEGEADTASMRAALSDASTDPGVLASMHLRVECIGDAGMRSLEVFGSGVGIWEKRRQFQLARPDLLAMIESLQDADFAGFEPVYGGPPEPEPRQPDDQSSGFAVEIICSVALDLGDAAKISAQRRKGAQSEELWQLAEDLLALATIPARTGVEATSLTDGLDKVGSGVLAPETMSLMLHRRPEVSAGANGGGFLLRVDGGTASNAVWSDSKGYAEPLVLRLEPADVGVLAFELARAVPEDLPINLYAEELNDVVIRVLDHKVTLQARRFAGMEPDRHGEKQESFNAMVQALDSLGQRVLAEGHSDSGP